MTYLLISLTTDKAHGVYETLDEARGAVLYDRLTCYQIWALDGQRSVLLIDQEVD